MENRREFLKKAATGAALLGAQQKLALAAQSAVAHRSKVVVATDPSLSDTAHEPIPARVEVLLDRAIVAWTGRDRPVDAWKRVLGRARVVGLKTNGLGGKGIATHAVLVYAVAQRLQQAGIQPGNIIIWDRNARDLKACGLTLNTDSASVRCFGSDVAGFEDREESWGSARVRLSKILGQCDLVIGMPILKDHIMSGVTFAMKNMYGVVERPQELHEGGCNPGVADLNCIPAIRDKVRFTIGDAISSVYDGGPGFRPERLWYPNALIVGEDRVAIDQVAWQMIERKRAEAGLKTLEATGRLPRYIATAADAAHALGTNDLARVHVLNV
jgi:uncharacterized protein (DUF362 family)